MKDMRNKLWIILVLSMIIIPGFSFNNSSLQNDVKQRGKKEQVEMLVNSRKFVFRAGRAEPSRGSSIDLTTNPNYVNFDPDLVESYLPFFGRAYSGLGYNSRAGLHFRGKPEIFTVEKKKKTWEITVAVRDETDNYRLYLSVTPQGFGSLSVSSNNLETISYTGQIHAPDEEK